MSGNNTKDRIDIDNLPEITPSGLETYLSIITFRYHCSQKSLEYLKARIPDNELLKKIEAIEHNIMVSQILYELTLQQLIKVTGRLISDLKYVEDWDHEKSIHIYWEKLRSGNNKNPS